MMNKISEEYATHITETSKTLIDHVILKQKKKNISVSIDIRPKMFSDHELMSIKLHKTVARINNVKSNVTRKVLDKNKFKSCFRTALEQYNIESFEQLIVVMNDCKLKSTRRFQ
ncbi:hypothetical protein HHI36_024001 [Cryptolaemus montrouzieri]|uniref:Uncharacterized protein n=1 Tax=Cryptolaemus montrouzieri TaxID=559131 RepID=A0ABD2NYB3_9CUCU